MDLTKEQSDVIDKFHRVIFKLIKLAKKIEPNSIEIEWIQKKLALAREVDPLIVISRCKDKLWFYRKEIIGENEDFFLNQTFSEFIKEDENKTFMNTLMSMMKKKFNERSEEEKKEIWKLLKSLLKRIIEFKKLTNDYEEE